MRREGILSHCAMPPRDVQKEILLQIEEAWDSHDIFVIQAPVAAGKSLVATTIAKWSGQGASIITPDNLLVKQYLDTFDLNTVRNKATYRTSAGYNIAKYKLKGSECVLNYYAYMANRAYNPVLICDEAHQLIDHLRSTTKIWKHLYNMPDSIYSTDDLVEWLSRPHKLPVAKQEKLEKLKQLLLGAPDRYILEMGVEPYRGQPRELLKVVDLIPRDNPPIYWPPSRVKKIVMMSATFSEEDVYDLGLDKYRVKMVEVDSPIPADRRPIIFRPIANMKFSNRGPGAEAIIDWCRRMHDMYPTDRALIHTTYSVVKHLRKAAGEDSRFMFHTKWNKEEVMAKWLESPGKILVGCGMTTGISLDYDKCKWQAIANLPFPNTKDKAVRANMQRRPESFYWSTIRHVLQATGRVCRTPTDYGVTFCLDSRFEKVYNEHNKMFPKWFRSAYSVRK